jgi:hypothetical protein
VLIYFVWIASAVRKFPKKATSKPAGSEPAKSYISGL